MKICHITTAHHPDDDRVFFKELRSLARHFDDVNFVSAYPEKVPADRAGVNFIPYRRVNEGAPSASIVAEGIKIKLGNMRALCAKALEVKADIYHCHEFESLMAAVRIKRKLGCKVIYDAHEMYSESFAVRFPPRVRPALIWAIQLYEKRMIRQCDFAIAATWKIQDYLAGVLGSDRVETLLNVPLPDLWGDVRPAPWDGGEVILCHDGHLNFDRGLKVMVQAAEMLSKRHRVKLRIIGDVFQAERTWLDRYVQERGLQGVIERTGWMDYHKVGQAIAACHVGLIGMQPTPNNIEAMPNKIFNYMYCGIPAVVPDFQVPICRIIREDQCGVIADTRSAQSLAAAIEPLLNDPGRARAMGQNAYNASRAKYIWPRMEERLTAVYRRLCPS